MGSGADKLTNDIQNPYHYTRYKIEPIQVIEDWDLPYSLGAVIKYIARFRYKGTPKLDIQKAREYLKRYFESEAWRKYEDAM